MRYVAAAVGVLVLILALSWILQGNDWFMYKVFAPKYEQVRRETFEQSKAYNQGLAQELDNEYAQYVKADSIGRAALAPIILHQVADYDISKFPPHLRQFIEKLRQERGMRQW